MSDLSVKRHAVISVIRNVIVMDRYVRLPPGSLSVILIVVVIMKHLSLHLSIDRIHVGRVVAAQAISMTTARVIFTASHFASFRRSIVSLARGSDIHHPGGRVPKNPLKIRVFQNTLPLANATNAQMRKTSIGHQSNAITPANMMSGKMISVVSTRPNNAARKFTA